MTETGVQPEEKAKAESTAPTKEAQAEPIFKKDDIVQMEYDAWTVSVDKTELFDTTHEEMAKQGNLQGKGSFQPAYMILGTDRLFTGFEQSIYTSEIGKEYTIDLAPKDAAGERDPKLVELHSVRAIARLPEMRRKDAHLDIGTELFMNNRLGRVVGITPGRVRVDFNPPLAGKTLRYKFKIIKKVDDPQEKAKAIIDMDFGQGDKFGIKVEKEEVSLELPDICKYDPNWFSTKYRVVSDLRNLMKLKKIRFIEEYVTKEEPAKEPAKEEPMPEEAKPEEKKA